MASHCIAGFIQKAVKNKAPAYNSLGCDVPTADTQPDL